MERDVAAHPEPTPAYLRLRVVVPVVVAVVVTGLLVARSVGPSDPAGEPVVAAPDLLPEESASPPAVPDDDGDVRDRCPPPGSEVDLGAANTIRAFTAAAAGERLQGLAVTDEVDEQLRAAEPGPPVMRMTRIGGFAATPERVTTCVASYWYTGSQLRTGVDLVVVEQVRPTRRAGAPRSAGPTWEVTTWARGEGSDVPRAAAVQLALLHGGRDCGTPDRYATVLVPAGDTASQLTHAVEELLAGTSGRANTASSSIPTDVQLVGVEVDGDAATVSVTGTDASVSSCVGRTAVDQVTATAEAVLAAAAPPEPDDTNDRRTSQRTSRFSVTVLVDGEPATSLRR